MDHTSNIYILIRIIYHFSILASAAGGGATLFTDFYTHETDHEAHALSHVANRKANKTQGKLMKNHQTTDETE